MIYWEGMAYHFFGVKTRRRDKTPRLISANISN